MLLTRKQKYVSQFQPPTGYFFSGGPGDIPTMVISAILLIDCYEFQDTPISMIYKFCDAQFNTSLCRAFEESTLFCLNGIKSVNPKTLTFGKANNVPTRLL